MKLEILDTGTVDISYRSDVTTLNAPNATKVNASGCSALTTLDAPNATYVDARRCSALTTLNAPNAYVERLAK